MTGSMPPRRRNRAMTPQQFAELIAESGMKKVEVTERLGVARTTVTRWLNGSVSISRANAKLIREVVRRQ